MANGASPLRAAVVFVHNHPSGEPAPSQEDHEITRRLKETSEMLGIRVLDHVVLGSERFFSFSDRGLL
jgi:DNA repair protein RadC